MHDDPFDLQHLPSVHGVLPHEREHVLSSPFVLDPGYGTRCSTVLLLGHDDTLYLVERRFDARGAASGENEWQLNPGDWPDAA